MKKVLFAIVMSALVTGCKEAPKPEVKEQEAETTPVANVTKALVRVKPTQGNKVYGIVSFREVSDGVMVIGDVGGLTPGKHGFHVHEIGDCSAHDASSAGGHFNPTGKKHGGPDSLERHVGDLGNLQANDLGNAHYERVDKVIQLNGPNSIIGKSIVVHAGEDDLKTDPSGNSGARIGCGVIEAVEQ